MTYFVRGVAHELEAKGSRGGSIGCRRPTKACFGPMDSFPSSPAGLTRGFIFFARWIAAVQGSELTRSSALTNPIGHDLLERDVQKVS